MKNARDLKKLFYTVTCQRYTPYLNSDNTVNTISGKKKIEISLFYLFTDFKQPADL